MRPKRILIIDDEDDVLHFLRELLTRKGYVIGCAASGGEALRSLEEGAFDLILMDLVLPDIPGAGLLREIRAITQTPVIVLTGVQPEPEVLEELTALGAARCCEKIGSLHNLNQIIESVLGC